MMNKDSLKQKLLCLATCFSFNAVLFANPSGFEKCARIFNELEKSGANPSVQNLVFNESNNFPHNIIVTFPSNADKKTKGRKTYNNELAELYMALRVEDFHERPEAVHDLARKISGAKRDYKVTLAFTYGDEFSESDEARVTGTEFFVSSLTDTKSQAAVSLRLSERNAIIPGGSGSASPSYLVKSAAAAFSSNSLSYRLDAGLVNFLYRSDFLKTDRRADFFFKADLPCVCVEFSSEKENLLHLGDFALSLINEIKAEDNVHADRHANFIAPGGKFMHTSEKLTVVLFLVFVFSSFFALCELSFINRASREKLSSDVLRLWYLIPLTVAVTVAALFISELAAILAGKLFSPGVYLLIAVKMATAFLLSSLSVFAFLKSRGVLMSRAYSYLLTVCAIFNLVSFMAIDISLFYLFALEYALIYLTRPERRAFTLSASFFVLLAPFVPYSIQVIKFARPESLEMMVKGGIGMNTVMALLILPFEVMLLRIIGKLNENWKKASKKTKSFWLQNILWITGSFAICLAIVSVADLLIPEKYKRPLTVEKKTTTFTDSTFIRLSVEDIKYFGETTRILSVRTESPCESLEVFVFSERENPILHSDNDYVSDRQNATDRFRLPVNPPEEMTFRYIANQGISSTVVARATFTERNGEDGERRSIHEKRLFIDGEKK